MARALLKNAEEAWWEQTPTQRGRVKRAEIGGQKLDATSGNAIPDTFSMEKAYVDSPEPFLLFLEALIRGRYGNIIRAKG